MQIPLIAGRPRELPRNELVSDQTLHYHLRGLDVTHQGPSLIFYVAGRHMKSDRPIDLALTKFQFHFPVTAVASILHRLTGMVLFVGAMLLLYLLDLALESEAGLQEARDLMAEPLAKLALWVILTTLGYHFVAGIKHILLDFHIGTAIGTARIGAYATFGIAAILAVLAGAWLW